ncbi:MAG: glycosyltransferase [Alphaproteobacteria bacterium]
MNTSYSNQSEHRPPLFSVIIPVRNDTSHLRLTLAALAEQSLDEPFEVLVSDNGSDDDVASAVADYHATLDLYVFDAAAAHGSYGARNVALSQARGKYLAFTDADTVPTREWLLELQRVFQREGDDVLLGGHVEHLWRNKTPQITEIVDAQRHLKQKTYVNHVGFAATANMAIARDHARRLGGFDENFRSGGDLLLGARARAAGLQLIFVPEAIVKHRARHTIRSLLGKTGRVSRATRERCTAGFDEIAVRAELRKFFPRAVRTRLFHLDPPFRSHLDAVRGLLLHWLLDAYSAAVTLGLLNGGDDARQMSRNLPKKSSKDYFEREFDA